MHEECAVTYYNIGNIHYDKGDYEKALNYYDKSLKINIQHYGEMHVQCADTYNNIGIIHKNKGDNEKALIYYEKSLEIKI